jgi:hypothetical protein
MKIGAQIAADLFALALLSALCATAGQATTLRQLSLAELVSVSNAVARVRCTSVQTLWKNGSIWTFTAFQVMDAIKGSLPAQITVRLPGGRVGHLTSTVAGTPTFRVGEEAVLFLEHSTAGEFTIAGWVEGTFRIWRDSRTSIELVTQDSSAFAVFDPATRSFRAEGIRGMRFDEFRARLAALSAGAEREVR